MGQHLPTVGHTAAHPSTGGTERALWNDCTWWPLHSAAGVCPWLLVTPLLDAFVFAFPMLALPAVRADPGLS